MRKASAAVFVFLFFFSGQMSLLRAQYLTGSIQGTVADKSGKFIAGATVSLSSTAMLGNLMMTTGKAGGFDFAALAPGVYTVTAEIPGFQTFIRDRIVLSSGMSFLFRIELSPSEQELEQDLVAQEPPTSLDTVSAKTAVIKERGLLRSLPLARDFGAILNTAPGVISAGYVFDAAASVQGGTLRDNAYLMDGANLTDMFTMTPLLNLNIDQIEEVEIIPAGEPVSQLPAGGAYINVVSKSGGNSAAGELGLFFISDGLNKGLWTPSQVKDLGVGPPVGDKNLFESSLSMGGPILEDRAWYFLAGRYLNRSITNNFIGPFVDILGRQHDSYDWSRRDLSGFFKLTVRPISNAKFMAWINFADAYQPVYEDPSPRLPFLSTHILDHDNSLGLYGVLDYALDETTQVYVGASYLNRNLPTSLQADAQSLPWTDDAGDLYGPLSGADYNSQTQRQRIRVNASLRRFVDDFLGVPHTLNVGADFDDSTSTLDWWRQDNMLWYLDSRNPNNYFYYDRGLLGFWTCSTQ